MRVLKILIVLASIYLAVFLWRGGRIPFINVDKPELATPVIAVSALILIYTLLKSRSGFSDAMIPIVLFCSFHILYMANYKTIWATDTIPGRYLPLSIIREGDFDLDEFRNLYSRTFIITNTGEHYVSSYPVGPSILALPIYLLSGLGHVKGNEWIVLDLEKFAAATIVALSAVLIYLTVRRLAGARMSALIAIIYALGSSSFSVSSQALWQHGASQLATSATLYCLVRGKEEARWIAYAGFPCAFSVLCRPTDFLIAAPISLYVLIHHRRDFPKFVLFALPCVAFYFLYNAYYFRNPARTQFRITRVNMWHTPFWRGFTGQLLSPARGLFIYSPIFLFAVIGAISAWRKKEFILLRYLAVGMVLTVLMYSIYSGWWGGDTYGPRLLSDITPALALFLVPVEPLLTRSKAATYLFSFLMIFSIAAHANGAYIDDGTWNATTHLSNTYNYRAWLWTDNQLVNTPKNWIVRSYIKIKGIPSSTSAPGLVDTSFKTDLASNLVLSPFAAFRVRVDAVNSGQAVWISSPNRAEGQIRFQCNWKKSKNQRVEQIRNVWLRRDVFPNEQYVLDFNLEAPQKSGDYVLQLGFTTIRNAKVVFIGQIVEVRIQIATR